MENVVDFKVVWPLLRKEGWTWKPAKGLQIHANYLKPGCKLRGGKHGVDYFNGEDALLAHVKADKDLCTRLHLTNIMVRPNAVPLDCADIHDDVESRSGDGSESEYEDDPNAAESEVDDEDDENSVAECDDREDDQGGEDTQGASLRHPGAVETHFEPLGFADAEPSDPNLVLGEIEKSIESDEEGEDSVGVADMLDTDDEVESLCEESVVAETSRIAGLLNEVELERLHMAVEGMLKKVVRCDDRVNLLN
ncbi:hypothetical protein AM587_10000780 [Phytophthora nicotianae]|uniref:Uncharacterized protein n=1 Tax=Phytophthora nicotianae TaxID=4792 RepID=A0A0W8C1K9_PHYNI|nr:hypothetical protein AM587_10000780 [Phytophthora nicotianae]